MKDRLTALWEGLISMLRELAYRGSPMDAERVRRRWSAWQQRQIGGAL